jgi:hypothetical protein
MGLGSCLLAERADPGSAFCGNSSAAPRKSCLASNIDRQGSAWTTSITIACSAQSSGSSSGRWRGRSHLRFRLRLSHTSGTAACRCRILQPRRDIAGGADVDPAPRRWCPRRVPSRVGVLQRPGLMRQPRRLARARDPPAPPRVPRSSRGMAGGRWAIQLGAWAMRKCFCARFRRRFAVT